MAVPSCLGSGGCRIASGRETERGRGRGRGRGGEAGGRGEGEGRECARERGVDLEARERSRRMHPHHGNLHPRVFNKILDGSREAKGIGPS